MTLLQISSQTVLVTGTEKESEISIRNKASGRILVKFVLSNPEQYTLSQSHALLQPDSTCNLKLNINPGDLNQFNYRQNCLYILYSKPDPNLKAVIKNFEIGKEKDSIGTVKITIKVDMDMPPLSQQIENKLKKYLKVVQVSSPTGIVMKHSPFLQELASMFGKICSIVRHQSVILIRYESPISIVPQVIINPSKDKIIESVYSCSYPTLDDIVSIQQSKGIAFSKVDEVSVPSIISDFNQQDQILMCKDDNTLFLVNMANKQIKTYPHQNFKIGTYSPYMCVVLQYKYMHFYENWSQPNIIKIKLKKLEIKCFCRVNNNLFAGGKNRSHLAFKQSTVRREIMIYENFKVVDGSLNPSRRIRVDDSDEDITMLICQSPYIFAYCKPNIYLVNAQRLEVVIKLQRHLQTGILLEGRYLKSLISFIGVTIEDRIIRINFQKMGVVYGVQVDESPHKAYSVAQTKQGKVFMSLRDEVYEFNPVMAQITNQWKPKEQSSIIRQIKTNLKNQVVMLRNGGESSLVQFYKLDQYSSAKY